MTNIFSLPNVRIHMELRHTPPPLSEEMLVDYTALAEDMPDEAREAVDALAEIIWRFKRGTPYVLPERSLVDRWGDVFNDLPPAQCHAGTHCLSYVKELMLGRNPEVRAEPVAPRLDVNYEGVNL